MDERLLLRRTLERGGIAVAEAANGADALALCPDLRPSLLLLDVEMPGMDGLEVLRRLRADPELQSLPVIFLTARTTTDDKITGLDLGAQDYITKPFDLGEVLARVRAQLRIAELTASLHAANHELRERQRELDRDLHAAALIQQSLLPLSAPLADHLSFAWRVLPCQQVGGDLIAIHCLDEDRVAVSMVDVSGHGVPSAIVAVVVSQLLMPDHHLPASSPVGLGKGPAATLAALDREMPFERFRKYLTMVHMVIAARSGRVCYGNAGHPRPLLIRAAGNVEVLEPAGPMVGFGALVPFAEAEVTLDHGDRLLLFTDGLTERRTASGSLYGDTRLAAALADLRHEGLDDLCDGLLADLQSCCGAQPPDDDIALLVMERR